MEDFTAAPLVIMVIKIEDSLDACLIHIQAEDTSAVTDLKADFMEIDVVSVSNIYDLDYINVKLCVRLRVLSDFYACNATIIYTKNLRTN